jgi:hypothetical protein
LRHLVSAQPPITIGVHIRELWSVTNTAQEPTCPGVGGHALGAEGRVLVCANVAIAIRVHHGEGHRSAAARARSPARPTGLGDDCGGGTKTERSE